MNYLDQPRILVVNGALADVPPRPSILDILIKINAQHQAIQAQRAADIAARIARLSGAKDRCLAKHIHIAIDAIKAARGAWIPTAALRDAIEAQTGVKYGCDEIGKALRRHTPEPIQRLERSRRMNWRWVRPL